MPVGLLRLKREHTSTVLVEVRVQPHLRRPENLVKEVKKTSLFSLMWPFVLINSSVSYSRSFEA
jgi:hypothetical protein